jgi:two-component system, NarL family, nitrate/nitrite response regulator NarL
MTRILIADDHPIVLEGLAALLEDAEFDVVARCRTGDEAASEILRLAPDIALLDIQMPGQSGLDILRDIRARRALTPRVIILTASLDPSQLAVAIQLETDGLVLKEAVADRVIKCVVAVAAGEQWIDNDALKRGMGALARRETLAASTRPLSAREAEVARLAAAGLRNKDIAEALGLSQSTVKMHLGSIFEKLNVETRAQLAAMGRDFDLG